MNRTTGRATAICISAVALCVSAGPLCAQPTLKITAPENGALVYSGAELVVTVEASPANAFQDVTIFAPFPVEQVLQSPPYRFSIMIPSRLAPGQYSLYADGIIRPGYGADSPAVDIQVEHSGTPLRLTGNGIMDFQSIMIFQSIGQRRRATAFAEFADTSFFVDNSTQVKYSSDNERVATVDSEGMVTAVAPGTAKITIEYQGLSTVIRVTVEAPSHK